MTEMPYTDADVELVAGWVRRWLGASTIRQRDRDNAVEVLSLLAAAGRLPAAHHQPLLALTAQDVDLCPCCEGAVGPIGPADLGEGICLHCSHDEEDHADKAGRREPRAAATGGGPCGTCGKPFWTHVCLSCSPDKLSPGPGCHNCRQTGMDQTPCLPLPTSRWEVQL